MTTQTILIAFGLTMIAGLSTGLGSILAFFTKRSNNKALSGALGLSAGVMVYISFMEMMPQSLHLLSLQNSEQQATIYMLLAFFGGIALIWGIDLLIPEDENPHEMHRVEEVEHKSGLKRTGIMLALAIGIHNFPEGLATFASTLSGMDIAIPIVIAIAIHNIPEGIAVSVPIYHATGNRKKPFGIHSYQVWPNRWEPCLVFWYCYHSGPIQSTPFCWHSFQVSWSSSLSTNFCPEQKNMDITIGPSEESSAACS